MEKALAGFLRAGRPLAVKCAANLHDSKVLEVLVRMPSRFGGHDTDREEAPRSHAPVRVTPIGV